MAISTRLWNLLRKISPGSSGTASEMKVALESPVVVTWPYNAPVDATIFTAIGKTYRVLSITVRVDVVGSDGSAVTLVLTKAASGTAPASGTPLHAGTANLKGAANTNQTLTIDTAVNTLAAGESICADVTGTTTAARGTVTVILEPTS